MILLSNIEYSNDEIFPAHHIDNGIYSGKIVYKVYNIDTNLYNKELNGFGSKVLKNICYQVACLQQKRFPKNVLVQ